MTIIAVVFGAYIAFRMQHDVLYLIDFISDSDKIDIRFFKGNKEIKKKMTFNEIEVVLKNTTTRSGFNCELRLKINDDKFLIDNTFEWTFQDMKDLFEYIKFFKNEPLTQADKFNVSKMREKINKTHQMAQ